MSEPRPQVMVVDDKENMLKLFSRILGEAYEVTPAADGTRALALLASREFDVVVTDIQMPGADGFAVLREVKRRAPDTEVVLVTAFASIPKAVEAMREGAYDYLSKPFDPDEVALVVARALERRRQRREAAGLPARLAAAPDFHGLRGTSAPMRQLHALLAQVAARDLTVLLTGETGTGKELAARAVHAESARAARPFVAVNCGALPAELVESELFGHAKGAFTGATAAKAGLFEEAHGGTLFLDEMGDLPLPVQVKLNRALQEKEVRRVGTTAPVKVDVRVVAATHRDLQAEVAAGRFREDLYYRLNVVTVRLPALRERREDIPLLAMHFLARAGRPELEGFTPEALRALTGAAWPGNVRQLENAVARAAAVAAGPRIQREDLPPELDSGPSAARSASASVGASESLARLPYREAVDSARDSVSRDYLAALMQEFGGNVTHAAERAGMERESLHRLLKRYGVRSDDFKRAE
ncbi:sigma-54-dependent Fis family transcriptional regulator [Corallococcus sp. H22C18031201]|uniref:sigma-54-dependent transcriptional regulator n=1 Tax=Citreicoccus inhibens TaxID=2849499 RepID=UPI000E770423|nr:sigma-54 dependent transcriptional regulator [Citreicoccus inhibens]MBU8896392.1 sigma-54 dependent transcriptional regulator [Citreicoccus inhibens]RJS24223.1 sigma-54-dependent Fis family transcriptional regulator [Corallococcus sp. H22C18031201]